MGIKSGKIRTAERDEARAILIDHIGPAAGPISEKGLYKYSKEICGTDSHNKSIVFAVYHDTLNNIVFNLGSNNPNSKKIIRDIKKGSFNPYNLAYLAPEEFNQDQWDRIILRRNTTEKLLNDLRAIEWRPCKCKCIWHYYYQLQTRSCDEATTTFYVCRDCGKTTKINV
jgi:DNA-directed RNA polymerase subunit M/transcription elongation factor TFIIS